MGVPLQHFQLTRFFELILASHLHPKTPLYYKDVLTILNQPSACFFIPDAKKIITSINSQNLSHLTLESLHLFAERAHKQIIDQIFGSWENDSSKAIDNLSLIHICRCRRAI